MIDILHEFAALLLLTNAQLVIYCLNMISLFEDSQIRQRSQIINPQLRCNNRLIINTYQEHEVLHATNMSVGI